MEITVGMKGTAETSVTREDTAYEVGSGELLVYANEYCLGVAVTCADTTMVETYTRQVAEMMIKALQPE